MVRRLEPRRLFKSFLLEDELDLRAGRTWLLPAGEKERKKSSQAKKSVFENKLNICMAAALVTLGGPMGIGGVIYPKVCYDNESLCLTRERCKV